jgi:hypothetical protein
VSVHYYVIKLTCCDVRYDFRIKTMFGSSLSPVVCRRAHVLFTLCVCVCVLCLFAHSGVQHILLCFCFVFLRLVYPYVASYFGLSIFDCSFGIR